jgi:hypothetical protein
MACNLEHLRCRTLWIGPRVSRWPRIALIARGKPARLTRGSRGKSRKRRPLRLLGYLASVLPVQDPDFQVRFVLEREKWKRECAATLLAGADGD